MIDLVQGVLAAGVRSGTPILYAMLGEIVAERAGVVNLGADGGPASASSPRRRQTIPF